MSRAGDFLNEADFDDNDMQVLKNRMSWQVDDGGVSGAARSDITDLMTLLKKLYGYSVRLAEVVRGNTNAEEADDLILSMRDDAAKVMSHIDALEDSLAEFFQGDE